MRFLFEDLQNSRFLEQTQTISSAVLGAAPHGIRFDPTLEVQAKASLTPTDVIIDGQLNSTLHLICGRCLEEFDIKLTETFRATALLNGLDIDIMEDIRDAFFLNLPMNPVCREKCQGLCPVCGVNRNQVLCRCNPVKTSSPWDILGTINYGKSTSK